MNKQQARPGLVSILLAVYLCGMVYLLFIRNFHFVAGAGYATVLADNFRPVPFDEFITYVAGSVPGNAVVQTSVFNLVWTFAAFLPAGIFLPCYSRKCRRLSSLVVVLLLLSAGIEALQLFLMAGTFSTTSILMYTLGGLTGFQIWKMKWMQRLLVPWSKATALQ